MAFLMIGIALPSFVYAETAGDTRAGSRAEEGVSALAPMRAPEKSLATALLLDLAVPGGGHFYTGDTYTGVTFAALKVVGAYMIYYCYADWKYRRSLYRASRRANENIDPGHRLEFEDPEGGYMTVDDYRRGYDRAAQRFTFSILANAALYVVSAAFVWYRVTEINENAVPTFELQHSRDTFDLGGEYTLAMRFSYRF